MNSNWFKLVMKMTKVKYGKNLLLKGVPIMLFYHISTDHISVYIKSVRK